MALEVKLGASYRVKPRIDPPSPTRPRVVPDQDVAQVIEMFNAGSSKGAIARAIGRSHSTVRRILDRATAPAEPQMSLRLLDLGGES